jgi:hypothetical protein
MSSKTFSTEGAVLLRLLFQNGEQGKKDLQEAFNH